jgi:hypothetical protein
MNSSTLSIAQMDGNNARTVTGNGAGIGSDGNGTDLSLYLQDPDTIAGSSDLADDAFFKHHLDESKGSSGGGGGATKQQQQQSNDSPGSSKIQLYTSSTTSSSSSRSHTLHDRATSLQQFYHKAVNRTEDKLENAATILQRVFRGFIGRQQFKDQRMEEYILSQSPLTTLFCFLMFLFIIIMACVMETENTQYYMAHQLEDWIVMEEFTSEQSQIYKNFNDIESKEEFWQYMQGPFVNNLFTEGEGVNELFDGTVLTGAVRLRQIRVDPDCDTMQQHVPKIFVNALDTALAQSGTRGHQPHAEGKVGCWPPYASDSLSMQTFGNVTRTNQHGDAAASRLRKASTNASAAAVARILPSCFEFSSGAESAPISHVTTRTMEGWEVSYPAAGGHVCDLPGNFSHAQAAEMMSQLKALDWIDEGTRSVMLEMSIYSTNENMFAYGVLMVEFWNTGAVQTYPTIATLIAEDFDSPLRGVIRIALRAFIYLCE